jgi:phosphoglycolate phosphatase-like HAD superfamily hydrolase
MLMIGDAPGDMKAAKAVGARFFPINPGSEEKSWERLREEGLVRFFAGGYSEEYENDLIADFNTLLPEIPPWKKL